MSEKRDRSSWDRKKKPVSANEPDIYDLVRDYLLNGGEKPTNVEASRLAEMAPPVWAIMLSQISTTATIKIMQEHGLCLSYRDGLTIVSDVEKVYGRVAEADTKGRRALLVEILMETMRKAMAEGDHPVVLRAVEKIAKLEGLNVEGTDGTNIYQQLVLPAPTLSSDPSIIEAELPEIAGIDEQYD
jgi:hypothetical protein